MLFVRAELTIILLSPPTSKLARVCSHYSHCFYLLHVLAYGDSDSIDLTKLKTQTNCQQREYSSNTCVPLSLSFIAVGIHLCVP
jgi:hypothetical protein